MLNPLFFSCCRMHHFPFPAVIPHLFSLIPLTLHFVTCKHVCSLLFPFFFSLQTDLLIPNLSKISPWLTFSSLLLFLLWLFSQEIFWDVVKSTMSKSAGCLCQELASTSSISWPLAYSGAKMYTDVRDDGMEGLVIALCLVRDFQPV